MSSCTFKYKGLILPTAQNKETKILQNSLALLTIKGFYNAKNPKQGHCGRKITVS